MPRMRSPQELLRDSRRELLSRSPRSSSPLERSEPIALMERGRTCGLFFRPPQQPPPPQQPFPTATAPAATAAPRSNHSLLQPPLQRPPHLSQRRVADGPWRRMFAARTAHRHPHAALRRAVTRALPSTAPATPAAPPHEARIHPSCCGCFMASPGKNRAVCVPSPPRMRAISPLPGSIFASCMLFGVKMARSSPHVSISGCNRAVLDTWRGNLAVKGGFSRRGARDHAWREELASAARPLRDSGL